MDLAEIIEAARRAVHADLLDEALVLLRAIEHLPSPRLWMIRADLHRERNEPEAAIAALDRAIALGGDDAARIRRALMWTPILGDRDALDAEWSRMTEALLELATATRLTVGSPATDLPWLDFYLAYRGGEDRRHREALARVLRQASPALAIEAPHVAAGVSTRGPVRLGLCSAHLRDHTIGRLNEALVHGLGDFGFHVVLAVPDPPGDAFSERLAASADEVVVLSRELATAQARLAEARLDVLHFPDLGMDPFTTWLSLGRYAPVQSTSWGHPITSGSPTIDAFLATPFLVPPGTEHRFTEEVVHLPDPMVCWTPPALPDEVPRAELGLPADRRVYLVPQSAFKLHPDFDLVLRGIAEADPDGVIALLTPRRASWIPTVEARLGLTSDQLVWVPRQPRERYLALLRAADVLLDPFPFGGGHTSLESLAMGTPIVTLPTDQLRGRLTACWYTVMGLPGLVASSPADFVRKAVSWARDPEVRDAVRAAIAEGTPRLFARRDAVAAHAAAFHQLVADSRTDSRAPRLRRVG